MNVANNEQYIIINTYVWVFDSLRIDNSNAYHPK